ncbi:MAG: ABC transporter ATP-binding protein [Erysipelotrichaceae bacterium]
MEKILETIKITKIYGYKTKHEFEALKEVSLEIYKGDFVSIMGPSGSGKSTLLNNISTIDIPTRGKVFIDGQNIRNMLDGAVDKFRFSNLGFIFQNFNMMDALNVYENISIPLTLANIDAKEIKERVEAVAEKLEIKELLNKFPNECSGGQCQRIAIARALVTNPKLIVADEPTGNLDSKNSHDVLTILKDLNEKEGVTIVMVTHDPMIASYGKRLLYIRDGKIDETLEKNDMEQQDYFYKIVEINSKESTSFLNKK